jgi:hypothetical protein
MILSSTIRCRWFSLRFLGGWLWWPALRGGRNNQTERNVTSITAVGFRSLGALTRANSPPMINVPVLPDLVLGPPHISSVSELHAAAERSDRVRRQKMIVDDVGLPAE